VVQTRLTRFRVNQDRRLSTCLALVFDPEVRVRHVQRPYCVHRLLDRLEYARDEHPQDKIRSSCSVCCVFFMTLAPISICFWFPRDRPLSCVAASNLPVLAPWRLHFVSCVNQRTNAGASVVWYSDRGMRIVGARSLLVITMSALLVPNLPPQAGPRAESFTRTTTVVQARSATVQAHRFALSDLSQNRRMLALRFASRLSMSTFCPDPLSRAMTYHG